MHNRLLALTELGRWDEAEALLPEVTKLVDSIDTKPVDALFVHWIEGRIATGRNHPAEAETIYLSVRRAYLDLKLPYRAAAVTLDLAGLLLGQNRLEEVRHYANEMIEEFRRQEAGVELIGAFALLEQAVLGQFLTADLLSRIRRHLASRAPRGRG